MGSGVPTSGGLAGRSACLWLGSVVFGLGFAYFAAIAVRGNVGGVLLFGALTAGHLTVAAGLWRRSRVAWWAACGLTAFWGALAGVCLAHGLDFTWVLGNLWLDGLVPTWSWCVAIAGSVGVLGLLLASRRLCDRPAVRCGSRPACLAAVLIVAAACVFWLWLNLADEPLRTFPQLSWDPPVVREEDNAYPALLELAARFPTDDGSGPELPARMPDPGSEDEEWLARARAVVDAWNDCLEGADAVLSRPRLVAPTFRVEDERRDPHAYRWLEHPGNLRLVLAARARLACLDARPESAMDDARRLLALGGLVCDDARDLAVWVSGHAVVKAGLEALGEAAASGGSASEARLHAELGRPLVEDRLRRGLRRALSADYDLRREEVELVKRWGDVAPQTDFSPRQVGPFRPLLRDPLPGLKVNMALNGLGHHYTAIAGLLDSYGPAPLERRGMLGSFCAQPLWTYQGHLLSGRDPIGRMLVDQSWARERPMDYWEAVARERLARVAIALRLHHAQHVGLPDSLDELVPGAIDRLPMDPFTGTPFGYGPRADAPAIWSVGLDRRRGGAGPPRFHDDITLKLTFASSGSDSGGRSL